MFKKHHYSIFIFIFSFIISVACIYNDVFYPSIDPVVLAYKQILSPLHLGWVFSGYSWQYNGYKYVNAVADVLLLLGSILFIATKYKESRLISFVFSLILISNITPFLNLLLQCTFEEHFFSSWVAHVPGAIYPYLINIAWIAISFGILKYFGKETQLQQEIVEENGQTHSYLVKASRGQRFLHPIIDIAVTIAVFSPILLEFSDFDKSAISRTLFHTEENLVEKYMELIIVGLRFLYYLFFEGVFGFSPAKLITQTRLVDFNSHKPSFTKILLRTLSRLVPFEAFSFFTEEGWHDKWSETMVAKEGHLAPAPGLELHLTLNDKLD